mmetsp:Transcript_29678/g.76194  ORF Transcript_29678/g.76194 Transcript_29678/m.76194 type:complete len:377 (+) Transcript_29678:154-1284(+)|eukprot:jgi/Tetstr1/460387/TSEL_000065.t1
MAGAVAVAVAVAVVTLLGAVGELPAALGARTTQNTIRYLADDRFPGWKGEVATIGARSAQDGSAVRSGLAVNDTGAKPDMVYGMTPVNREWMTFGDADGTVLYSGEVLQMSSQPRVFLYKNFLTQEECDFLISHSKNKLQASTVVDNKTGKSIPSTVRTSYGTHFDYGENQVVRDIEARVAAVTMLPADNGEPMQILRYEHGQKYEPHQDYFHDDYNQRPEIGGQRVLTVLMYLATVADGAGGETVFPSSRIKPGKDTRDPDVWSECARRGVAVKAVAGDAVVFYSIKPDGELDRKSLHGSCPTYEGEKWSATKWIRAGAYLGRKDKNKKQHTDPCHDDDIFMCREWAGKGECEKNPGFMLKGCRKSCKQCTPGSA